MRWSHETTYSLDKVLPSQWLAISRNERHSKLVEKKRLQIKILPGIKMKKKINKRYDLQCNIISKPHKKDPQMLKTRRNILQNYARKHQWHRDINIKESI